MATTVNDLDELLAEVPAGAWVAISESRNEVLAFGIDAQTVLTASITQGEDHPLILRVPEQDMAMFL